MQEEICYDIYDLYDYDDNNNVITSCDYDNEYIIDQVRFCNNYNIYSANDSIINILGKTAQFIAVMIGVQICFDRPLRYSIYENLSNMFGIENNNIYSSDVFDSDSDIDQEDNELDEDTIIHFLNKIEIIARQQLHLSKDIIEEILKSVLIKIRKHQHINKMKVIREELNNVFSNRKKKLLKEQEQQKKEADQIDKENEIQLLNAVNDTKTIENRKKSLFTFSFW